MNYEWWMAAEHARSQVARRKLAEQRARSRAAQPRRRDNIKGRRP
jgi:hypothetical protein